MIHVFEDRFSTVLMVGYRVLHVVMFASKESRMRDLRIRAMKRGIKIP